MIDFGKIVYLDVQKTGSSFVRRFLRRNLELPERAHKVHAAVTDHNPDVFYFISVRDPLLQYISLYQYGLEGRGGLAKRFEQAGMSDYYQPSTAAFETWLRFVLDPKNSDFFGLRYRGGLPALIGMQSFRFLMLSFTNAGKRLQAVQSKPALRQLYAGDKIHTTVVRTENLNADLEKLLDSEVGPFFRPHKRVRSFLQNSKKANISQPVAAFSPDQLSPGLIAYLKEREWFIYENFYPEQALKPPVPSLTEKRPIMFEYKLLSVPTPAKKAKGRKTVPDRMAHALGELMNEHAKDNWEYFAQETFPVEEKSGLMGKEKHVECRYLVFRREVGLEAMPLDKKLEKLRERRAETIVQAAPPTPMPIPVPTPIEVQTPEPLSEPAPEPTLAAVPEPFPEPMPSPQVLAETSVGDGEAPTRIFSPFAEEDETPTPPALGPAEKP